jgi:hypothetical protein
MNHWTVNLEIIGQLIYESLENKFMNHWTVNLWLIRQLIYESLDS